tara:strand:- start:20401 stop:21375 length:975 start_codon:yes stop_codon:yes gene_type:complete
MKRRLFIKNTSKATIGGMIAPDFFNVSNSEYKKKYYLKQPISICTWDFKLANDIASKQLELGSTALEGVIKGVAIEESNEFNTTVGYGGAPDREGNVSLDACVMDYKGNCGSVLAVKNVRHVAALARDVMNYTPHVILAGTGAEEFAISRGYKPENLLTKSGKSEWKEWLKKSNYKPEINIENHDTIGMICMDKEGKISGGCSTSGLAYKMKGRVGDSPIIGSGLYVDNGIGAAVATGMGEEVIKTVGSFLIVELMRQKYSPQLACEIAIKRIIEKQKNNKPDFQVAYLALNKSGEIGAYSIHKGFSYCFYNGINKNIKANSYY